MDVDAFRVDHSRFVTTIPGAVPSKPHTGPTHNTRSTIDRRDRRLDDGELTHHGVHPHAFPYFVSSTGSRILNEATTWSKRSGSAMNRGKREKHAAPKTFYTIATNFFVVANITARKFGWARVFPATVGSRTYVVPTEAPRERAARWRDRRRHGRYRGRARCIVDEALARSCGELISGSLKVIR